MPAVKVTYFFEEGQNGWTETWGISVSSVGTAVAAADALGATLATFRSTFTVCLSYRVGLAAYPSNRQVIHNIVNVNGVRGTGNVPPGPDPAPVGALCTVNYGAGQSRSIILRGLADEDVNRDQLSGDPQFTPQLMNAIQALQNQLTDNNWGFLVPDPAFPWTPVSSIQTDPVIAGRWNIFLLPGFTAPAAGAPIAFKGVNRKQFPWWTGKFLAIAPANLPVPVFSIDFPAGLSPALSGGFDVSRLYWRNFQYTVSPVNTVVLNDFRARKTGRPINLTRGRARGLRYRR
jgi:hypothetical protein